MRITDIEIRLCRQDSPAMGDAAMRDGRRSELEFLVLTARTDDGITASTFGFAGRGAKAAGEIAAASLKPFVIGRDPLYREQHWHEWRMANRWWHHVPIYSYGPFDILCWLLSAQAAGQPLYRYLGGYRDRVPTYVSSLVLDDADAYGREAAAVQAAGLKGYKLHPPGRDFAEDLDCHRAAREATGPDFALMSDPVASLTPAEALRLGRALEVLGYLWLEEPFFDDDMAALKRLSDQLDLPVVAGEVLPGHPYSLAPFVANGTMDAVRADVSWTGGVTGTLKTAHLAEAFAMNCEIHTAIYHPLELVNLHVAAAVKNCTFFELLYPIDLFSFGLAEPIRIERGEAILPEGPGLGIELDWGLIDRSTFAVL
jgi:L-alanine-DL-glutamate epimerase-like enolase superfamily enzyme